MRKAAVRRFCRAQWWRFFAPKAQARVVRPGDRLRLVDGRVVRVIEIKRHWAYPQDLIFCGHDQHGYLFTCVYHRDAFVRFA